MPIQFPKFLRRYDLRLLGVSNDDIGPGVVLGKKRAHVYQGHLREILTEPTAKFWKVELNPANIVYGEVERTLNLRGKASLDQFGVAIGGGLGRASKVTFSITGVQARTFVNGPGRASMFSLTPMLQALRKQKGRRLWKMVNNRWVVLEAYYASEATVAFVTQGNVDVQADVTAAGGIEIGPDASVTWSGRRSFRIANNVAVPFAFRGWKV